MVAHTKDRRYTLVGNMFVDPVSGQDVQRSEGAIPAFVDDFTSSEFSRPGLNACLSFLNSVGFDVLIVHAIDRLARDPYIRQTIEREIAALGARVEYVLGNYEESPEGEVRKDLDATFAKWENAKRVERSNRGKMRKAEMGKFVTGFAPYGYEYNPDAEGSLTIYEPEAMIVRQIFEWYTDQGMSIASIAKELNSRGIETSRKRRGWLASSVAHVLKNTAYVGYLYYNKSKKQNGKQIRRDKSEWIKIPCVPIVPPEVFEAARDLLNFNKEYTRKLTKRFYLL